MPLLRPPWPDRASTASLCPGSPRPRLPPESGLLQPGRPERPWRVWPGRTGPSHPVDRPPAPPPPPSTTDSPTHDSTPDPEPPPKPTHQPPPAPPHHDAHPDQTKPQTHNTPPRAVHPPPDPTESLRALALGSGFLRTGWVLGYSHQASACVIPAPVHNRAGHVKDPPFLLRSLYLRPGVVPAYDLDPGLHQATNFPCAPRPTDFAGSSQRCTEPTTRASL